MDLTDVIASLDPVTVTVERRVAPTLSNGEYTEDASPSTFDADGTLQPFVPREMLAGLQGIVEGDVIWFITATELRTFIEDGQLPADIIQWDGREYEVRRVKKQPIGLHYDVFAELRRN